MHLRDIYNDDAPTLWAFLPVFRAYTKEAKATLDSRSANSGNRFCHRWERLRSCTRSQQSG